MIPNTHAALCAPCALVRGGHAGKPLFLLGAVLGLLFLAFDVYVATRLLILKKRAEESREDTGSVPTTLVMAAIRISVVAGAVVFLAWRYFR